MKRLIAILALSALALVACGETRDEEEARRTEEAATGEQQVRLQTAQPIPQFSWSQIRQNQIEITMAQAETTQTTSFFFNVGSDQPVMSCPSIGFPIPTTAQLTNPDQVVFRALAISQAEPTGVYTGESTGTYVICVDAQGSAYAFYWEGFVGTASGPAEWNPDTGMIELIGPPSFDFSSGEGE